MREEEVGLIDYQIVRCYSVKTRKEARRFGKDFGC